MEAYGKILLIAIPAFLALVLLEKLWGVLKGNDTVPASDMISSLSSGITNVTKDVLGLSVAIISYSWLVNKVAIIHINAGWQTYLVAFVALDFAGYWVHRISHEYNFFWNNHIIHHSSEEFNLACALRQSISSIVRIFALFLFPAALLGVPANVIAVVGPLHLFAQFWYHTQHIGKMGFLEYIIVTPSHHRVHHAINPIYLDKNYSQIFIVWDFLFGTFQQERDDTAPVYGVTRPVRTWNPIKINFMHLFLLIKDAWRANALWDKLRIWFMPLGWRPADVTARYPVYKIDDVYNFEKYNPTVSKQIIAWSWVQMLVLLSILCYLFANIATIGFPNMFLYGAFVFLSVYAYTELLDKNRSAWLWELAKNAFGFFIIYYLGDWFGLSQIIPFSTYLILFYLCLSTLISFLLSSQDSSPTLATPVLEN
jgi:sterol desaturase/sphingolipid hydroxylase (fatty acid hydroxylase superfamily)